MSSQIEELKKVIKAIVITEKDGLDPLSLDNEYYDQEGKHIPFRQLGFESLVDFLQSLKDSVRFGKNRAGQTVVFAVVDQSTAHIHKFVQEQKPKAIKRKHPYSPPDDAKRARPGAFYDLDRNPQNWYKKDKFCLSREIHRNPSPPSLDRSPFSGDSTSQETQDLQFASYEEILARAKEIRSRSKITLESSSQSPKRNPSPIQNREANPSPNLEKCFNSKHDLRKIDSQSRGRDCVTTSSPSCSSSQSRYRHRYRHRTHSRSRSRSCSRSPVLTRTTTHNSTRHRSPPSRYRFHNRSPSRSPGPSPGPSRARPQPRPKTRSPSSRYRSRSPSPRSRKLRRIKDFESVSTSSSSSSSSFSRTHKSRIRSSERRSRDRKHEKTKKEPLKVSVSIQVQTEELEPPLTLCKASKSETNNHNVNVIHPESSGLKADTNDNVVQRRVADCHVSSTSERLSPQKMQKNLVPKENPLTFSESVATVHNNDQKIPSNARSPDESHYQSKAEDESSCMLPDACQARPFVHLEATYVPNSRDPRLRKKQNFPSDPRLIGRAHATKESSFQTVMFSTDMPVTDMTATSVSKMAESPRLKAFNTPNSHRELSNEDQSWCSVNPFDNYKKDPMQCFELYRVLYGNDWHLTSYMPPYFTPLSTKDPLVSHPWYEQDEDNPGKYYDFDKGRLEEVPLIPESFATYLKNYYTPELACNSVTEQSTAQTSSLTLNNPPRQSSTKKKLSIGDYLQRSKQSRDSSCTYVSNHVSSTNIKTSKDCIFDPTTIRDPRLRNRALSKMQNLNINSSH